MARRGAENDLELIHPVYLDVPMMVSFFAAVEGGFAYGTEVTERSSSVRSGEREGAGKVGLPSITSLFGVGFDMTGRIKSHSQGEEATETKVVREHTEASLFNLLREVLKGHDDFMEVLNPSQLEQVNAGQLVEVSGEIVGNPLEQVLEVVGRVLPYVQAEEDESQTVSSPPNRAARRNQARKPQQARQVEETPPEGFDQSGWKIFQVMRDDVEKAKVRDLVLKSSDGLKVILTVSREFFKDDTAEYLLGGRFTALGKITRVLESGEMINLTRRTALGLAGPDVARGLINEIGSDSEDFAFRAEDPIVEAPALQLLPLAIFICICSAGLGGGVDRVGEPDLTRR